MIKVFCSLAFIALFACCSSSKNMSVTKADYTRIDDSTETVLKGYINRQVLEGDTAFKWFKENMKYGEANEAAVKAFRENASKFSMLVFGGTWCHDTQNLLPVFYRLVDKSGYPESKITVVAVGRDKVPPRNFKKYNLVSVPTFIVLKDGTEVGRVVEYGKEGMIDKELGDIVSKL